MSVRPIRLGVAFGVGFAVGALLLVPIAMLAFMSWPKWLEFLLAPGSLLVNPLVTGGAPGVVTIPLAMVVNGVVYGIVAVAIAMGRNLLRRT